MILKRLAPALQSGLSVSEAQHLEYRHQLIDMQKMNYREFVDRGTPDALVFAILCDFQGESVDQVVRQLLKKLQTVTADDEKTHRDYLHMLEILADYRNLNINIGTNRDRVNVPDSRTGLIKKMALCGL